ncbi:MAG: tetratricopeptide repeat protein [Rhodoferax sp.]
MHCIDQDGPFDIVADFVMGEQLKASGQTAGAAECFQRVTEATPSISDHWLYRAVALMRLRKVNEAEAPLRHFLSLHPKHIDGTHHLVRFLIDSGRTEEAVQALTEVIDSAPERVDALAPLVSELWSHGVTEAQPLLYRLAGIVPHDILANFLMGEQLFNSGQASGAAEYFQRVVNAVPGVSDHWLYTAVALIRLRRDNAVEAPLRHFLTLQPNHVDATYHLARFLIDNGRTAEAMQVLAAVIDSAPARVAVIAVPLFQLRLSMTKEADVLLHRVLDQLGEKDDTSAIVDFAKAAYYWEAPQWVVRATAQARTSTDHAALRVCHDLVLPLALDRAEDIKFWIERFRANVSALKLQAPHLENPLEPFVQPPHYAPFCYGLNTRELYADASDAWQKLNPQLNWTAPHCESWRTRPLNRRIRVGFLTQPTFPLIWGIARELDRSRFELVLLVEEAFRSEAKSDWTDAVDRQVVIPDTDLAQARHAVASQELDILIHTPWNGFRYFMSHARLAPIQCVLCEPAYTDGVPNLDYYISWAPAEPTRPLDHYLTPTALMARPPYWVERNYCKPADLQREDFDLPPDKHWYVCPGTPLKMVPDFDQLLLEILRRDPDGIVVLLRSELPQTRVVERRLRAALGPDADRVKLMPKLAAERCHAMLMVADAVLDTWPIGGMSSSYVSIHGAIPTVTLPVDIPFGRWLAAMYEFIGVTDLIATDAEDYIRLALRLAHEPTWRHGIAQRIKASNQILIEDHQAVRELEVFLTSAVMRAHFGKRPRPWKTGRFIDELDKCNVGQVKRRR